MNFKDVIFDPDGVLGLDPAYCLGDASKAGAGDYNLDAFAQLPDIVK